MDIIKARGLSDQELVNELTAARRNLYDLRFQLATRQLTDHTQLAQTRRSIARILTVMTERNLEPIEAAPPPPARRTRRTGRSAAAKPAAKETATATPRGGKS